MMSLGHDKPMCVGLRRGWRALKWVGTASCILIVVAFLYSIRHAVLWDSPSLQYESLLMGGTVFLAWRPDQWRLEKERYPPSPGWGVATHRDALHWWPRRAGNSHWEEISVPLWMPLALVALPAAGLWYLDRRHFSVALHRWAARLGPRQPTRLSFWKVITFTALHAVAVVVGLTLPLEFFWFLFPRLGSETLLEIVLPVLVGLLFWLAPGWGVLWAWLYVRIGNRELERQRRSENRCLGCGYNLTGNISGTCPECGTAVGPTAQSDGARSLRIR